MEFCGHDFADATLLAEALTTPSCRMADAAVRDNQRLEFLGDAVLGMIAAERLYAAMPGENEGSLTVRRTRMVSTAALAAAAARAGIAAHLKVGRGAPPVAEGSKTLADAVEAVIGAAYLDGGIDAAREVFASLGLGEESAAAEWGGNPKGELQVRAQAMKPPRHPEYTLVSVAGKSHEPVFTSRVRVEGMGEAEASARTHKEAEAAAAAKLLKSVANACVGSDSAANSQQRSSQ